MGSSSHVSPSKPKGGKKSPENYSPAPHAINRVFSVASGLLVSISEPLSFPLLTGRLLGVCSPLRAGDLPRARPPVLRVFSTQNRRPRSDLPQVPHQVTIMKTTCGAESFPTSLRLPPPALSYYWSNLTMCEYQSMIPPPLMALHSLRTPNPPHPAYSHDHSPP